MKLVRHISTFAFFITRIIAVFYILTVLHLLVSVLFKLSTFKVLENNRFAITYPFTSKNFLLGSENSSVYIFEMVSVLFFYGIFFWLLGNVFKTFRQQKLFTEQGIKYLKWFYVFNLLICPVLFLCLSVYSIEDYPYTIMMIAHGIVGIFALFIAAIFQQGVKLQKDQDLYI
ncbi:MAG: DUF2975 domain-containing protein [Ferruginibacter sp.]